jgi:hypothetical protein
MSGLMARPGFGAIAAMPVIRYQNGYSSLTVAGRFLRNVELLHAVLGATTGPLSPAGEVSAGGQGVRVLRARHLLAYGQQPGEQVPGGGGRVPASPALLEQYADCLPRSPLTG